MARVPEGKRNRAALKLFVPGSLSEDIVGGELPTIPADRRDFCGFCEEPYEIGTPILGARWSADRNRDWTIAHRECVEVLPPGATNGKRSTWSGPVGELRTALELRSNACCEGCGVSQEDHLRTEGRRLHLHFKEYRIPRPEKQTLSDVELLCTDCHRRRHATSEDRLEGAMAAVRDTLGALGADMSDPNYLETPRRVASYLLEHFRSPQSISEELESFEAAVFPAEGYDEVVAVAPVRAEGICPHHLLPVRYRIGVAYIPAGNAVGLSKLARVAKLVAALPLLQEKATSSIADTLERILVTEHVAVVMRGEHLCMCVRGVEAADARTTTSVVRGAFRDKPEARAEVMALLGVN